MFRKVHAVVSKATVIVDGQAVEAEVGEPLAAVILRCTRPYNRVHPVSGAPRAPYCMMGICHDCIAIVDGVPSTQTCCTMVLDGMVVQRQVGAHEPPDVA